jgi:hypothetical protein
MIKRRIYVLCIFFILLHALSSALEINIFCPKSGRGLEVDGKILKSSLESLGAK